MSLLCIFVMLILQIWSEDRRFCNIYWVPLLHYIAFAFCTFDPTHTSLLLDQASSLTAPLHDCLLHDLSQTMVLPQTPWSFASLKISRLTCTVVQAAGRLWSLKQHGDGMGIYLLVTYGHLKGENSLVLHLPKKSIELFSKRSGSRTWCTILNVVGEKVQQQFEMISATCTHLCLLAFMTCYIENSKCFILFVLTHFP